MLFNFTIIENTTELAFEQIGLVAIGENKWAVLDHSYTYNNSLWAINNQTIHINWVSLWDAGKTILESTLEGISVSWIPVACPGFVGLELDGLVLPADFIVFFLERPLCSFGLCRTPWPMRTRRLRSARRSSLDKLPTSRSIIIIITRWKPIRIMARTAYG